MKSYLENFKIEYDRITSLIVDILLEVILLLIVLFFLYFLIIKLYYCCKTTKSFFSYLIILFIIPWIYYVFTDIEYYSNITNFYNQKLYIELLSEISSFIFMADIGLWILLKISESFTGIVLYLDSKDNNLKQIKKDIKKLIFKNNQEQNLEMKKIYYTLQTNAESLKKQKRDLIFDIMKNFLFSIIFFGLGLVIPRIITYFCNVF